MQSPPGAQRVSAGLPERLGEVLNVVGAVVAPADIRCCCHFRVLSSGKVLPRSSIIMERLGGGKAVAWVASGPPQTGGRPCYLAFLPVLRGYNPPTPKENGDQAGLTAVSRCSPLIEPSR